MSIKLFDKIINNKISFQNSYAQKDSWCMDFILRGIM